MSQSHKEHLVKMSMHVVHAVQNQTRLKMLQDILTPVTRQMDAAPPRSDQYHTYLISVELDVEQAKALYKLLKTPPEEV